MNRTFFLPLFLILSLCFVLAACDDSSSGDDDDDTPSPDGDLADGDQPALDGDIPSDDDDDNDTDGDTEAEEEEFSDGDTDGDTEQKPDGYCEWEHDCDEGEHCHFESHRCLTACDPTTFDDDCPGSETVCVMLLTGEGIGNGVCVAKEVGGKEYGQNCNSSTPCKQGLYCDQEAGRCTKFCDPDREPPCENGLACEPDSSVYNLPVCVFCGVYSPCEEGFRCDGGYCVSTSSCTSVLDCPDGTVCRAGYCNRTCATQGCPDGLSCDSQSGLCQNTCDPECAEGECCLDGHCGPCCSESCALGETCQFDAACAPGSHCCLPVEDCTAQEDGFCGNARCDEETGICTEQCPALCPFGTVCSASTNYECIPQPLQSSCTLGNFCNLMCFSCQTSQSGPLCQPDYTLQGCNPSCLPERVICGQGDIPGAIDCCDNNTCCETSDGTSVCCPSGQCNPGVGCEGGPTEPTCEECDALLGVWCLEDDEDSCQTDLAELEIYRNAQEPCYISTSRLGGTWLGEVMGCGTESLARLEENGKTCAFYWDDETNILRLNCQNDAGDETCQSNYWGSETQSCEMIDEDGDIDGDEDGDEDGDTDGDEDGDTDSDEDGDTDGDEDGDIDGDEDLG